MLLKEPFYAHFLSGIIREVTDKVPTAAVGFKSGKIALYVNENFFLKELKSVNERVAVIKHETLHIIFKHLFRMKTKSYDNQLFNVAADIVVNQLIYPWKLPDSAVTLDTFPELKLPKDKSVEWYYENLKQNASKDSDYKKRLEEIFEKGTHSDHKMWGENENFSIEVVETEVDRMIIQARDRTPAKDHGSIPRGIKSLIKNNEFLEYAKVFNNYYGTVKSPVINNLDKGKKLIFDIDWQGTEQIKEKKLQYKLITFFILPPSKKVLFERLSNRDMKDKLIVEERMKQFSKDVLHWNNYDYVVINDNLENCYNEVNHLIKSEIEKFNNSYDINLIKKHIDQLII